MSWLLLTTTTCGLILFCTAILKILEPDTFKTYMDSFWFTMTTKLTVGFGAMYPTTVESRIFTIIFIYVLELGYLQHSSEKGLEGIENDKRGRVDVCGKNHIVIIDWSHKAEHAAKEIMVKDQKTEIVVIDILEKLPFVNGHIHYIKGEAPKVDVLKKAII